MIKTYRHLRVRLLRPLTHTEVFLFLTANTTQNMENPLVYANGAVALTNSILVAKKFDRNHRDVLDSIRELIKGCAENSADPMFEGTTYVHPQNGQTYPMFVMNRDGFTLLAMGFTGDKALRFKLDYINAFNKMEAELKSTKPLTPAQQPLANAQMLVEMEQRQMEQERRQIEVENKVALIEDRIRDNGYMAVAGFANVYKVKLSDTMKKKLGKLASSWCRRMGVLPEKIKHERWGFVNTYPMQALRDVFKATFPRQVGHV